ncbi:serine hydrolase domain-containing protein [Naumannella huperziae]
MACLVVGVLAAVAIIPRPVLGPRDSGDLRLAADARAVAGDGRGLGSLAIARIANGRVSTAAVGDGFLPGPDTSFELGSVTKTFTGNLLADAVERGEIELDAPVERWMPELVGTPAGSLTPLELATHTSGLPSLPPQLVTRPDFYAPDGLPMLGGNPYRGVGTATMINWLRDVPLSGRGQRAYSNLGMSLLGHTVARAAGSDYPTLLRQRLLDPLGMTATSLALDEPAAPAARPHTAPGWAVGPWWGEAFAPAGTSTRTTLADLTRYARALLDGTAPGAAAMDPVDGPIGEEAGLAWQLAEVNGAAVVWHNGATAGTRTMLALDRQRGVAAIVFSDHGAAPDQDATIDLMGIRLVTGSTEPSNGPRFTIGGLVPVAIGLIFLTPLFLGLLRRRPPTRLAAVDVSAWAAAGLTLVALTGPWQFVPGIAWGVIAGVTLAAVVATARRAAAGRWIDRGAWFGVPSLLIGLAALGYLLLAFG